jgi:predicted RNase H-like nuclease
LASAQVGSKNLGTTGEVLGASLVEEWRPVGTDAAMEVVGVDAYRLGWVAVVLHQGAFERAEVASDFARLLRAVPAASVVAVDIPIGLLPTGWRQADREAKRFLHPTTSSVFLTPPRPVVEATSYQDANRRCRELNGQGLSQQAWALTTKLLQVERYLAHGDGRVYEVHPEVCFRALNGKPLQASKRTWAGQAERCGLLERAGIQLPDELGHAGAAAPDDVLAAAAAAWSAHRIANGRAVSLPHPPQQDPQGRPVAIWY